jgi:Leucine-rich repeat (LRR) protein
MLANLKKLDISYTNVTALPSEMGNLTQPWTLLIVGTHIDEIPAEVEALEHLFIVDGVPGN